MRLDVAIPSIIFRWDIRAKPIRSAIFAAMKETLAIYIEAVLMKHDCAIIPGLGGFVVQREPARILPDRIEPPHATIGFNPLLTLTDGYIATEHMRRNGLNYRQAAEEIDAMVREVLLRLERGDIVELGRVGRLHQQADGHLAFTPSDGAFLPDNFGLTTLYRPVAQTMPMPRRVVRLQPYVRYAAACIALLLLLVTPQNRHSHNVVDHATLDPGMFVRNLPIAEAVLPVVTDTVALRDTVHAETVLPKDVAADPAKKFHLIVAALDRAAAVNYCTTLQTKGYDEAHLIPHSNGLYRVAIRSYSSRKEAIRQMEHLRSTAPNFAKAWVYCE